MAKVTTVGEVKQVAEQQGLTLQELAKQWEIVVFLGQWDNDAAEVIVPNDFPAGKRLPVARVI